MTDSDANSSEAIVAAAHSGDALAQVLLGFCYANGDGVPKDEAQAVFWYRKAAEQGDADAQYELADVYGRGKGIPRDETQAVVWYRKAAEQGHADAQFCLGVCYEDGAGVPEDLAQAVFWYRKAEEQGNAYKHHTIVREHLRYIYATPEGFIIKAEQGDADAQFCLGVAYENGEDVPEDKAQAVSWYTKAAEQGHTKAQELLDSIYATPGGFLIKHERYVQTFLQLTFPKISRTDEYGDEQWDLLPGEIDRFAKGKLKLTLNGMTAGEQARVCELVAEQYRQYHAERKAQTVAVSNPTGIDGVEFELLVAEHLRRLGFETVTTTRGSGDFGADLVVRHQGKSTVVQCKRYTGVVGISAVQEILGAKHYYQSDSAWVIASSSFTTAAQELAKRAGVTLYDWEALTAGAIQPHQ